MTIDLDDKHFSEYKWGSLVLFPDNTAKNYKTLLQENNLYGNCYHKLLTEKDVKNELLINFQPYVDITLLRKLLDPDSTSVHRFRLYNFNTEFGVQMFKKELQELRMWSAIV